MRKSIEFKKEQAKEMTTDDIKYAIEKQKELIKVFLDVLYNNEEAYESDCTRIGELQLHIHIMEEELKRR